MKAWFCEKCKVENCGDDCYHCGGKPGDKPQSPVLIKFTTFQNGTNGWGCFEYVIEVEIDKIIRETPEYIVVLEHLSAEYSDAIGSYWENTKYFTNIDAFIKNEKEEFNKRLLEIVDIHHKTLEMAEKIKNNK